MRDQSREEVTHPMRGRVLSAKSPTCLAKWNVWALYQSGKLGNDDGNHHNGVGIVLSQEAAQSLMGWKPVSNRIITARLLSHHAKTTKIQVYASTEGAEEHEKDAFYDQLDNVLRDVHTHDVIILMGDFNAQINGERRGWEDVIGPHGSSQVTTDNGHRLLSLCSHHALRIVEKLKDADTITKFQLALSLRFELLENDDGNDIEDCWSKIKETTTAAADKTLYRIFRELTGAKSNASVRIKDKNGKILLTQEEQDACWIKHFHEVLNQPSPTTIYDFNAIIPGDLLDVDLNPITEREVEKAIKSLKINKAPGLDQISAEIIKNGGAVLKEWLTGLLNQCWEKECVPQEWKKGAIVKLPKKGSLNDCNNWRGITLLSIPGKVFCIVMLNRLKRAVDKLLREEQPVFCDGRSCIDQILTLRNIIKQSIEHQRQLLLNFVDFITSFHHKVTNSVDFKKAFDSVHRESLWKIAASYGIPPRFINIFKNLYDGSTCCVKTESGTTDFFSIETGVCQGCFLSPFLFTLVIDFVMSLAMEGHNFGIVWKDQKRLPDLDFADDIGFVLGTDGGSDEDVTARIGKASSVFKRLRPIVVVPTVLYAAETWRQKPKIANQLNVFQHCCLRRILNISYLDRVTNEEVLSRSKMKRLSATVAERRMRVTGHAFRMKEDRNPKIAMIWIPPGGRRKIGRPRNTWRRRLESDLKNLDVPWEDAQEEARDRHGRRLLVARCAEMHGPN
eukprot:gene16084-7436_t